MTATCYRSFAQPQGTSKVANLFPRAVDKVSTALTVQERTGQDQLLLLGGKAEKAFKRTEI